MSIHGPLGYGPNTLATAPLRFHASFCPNGPGVEYAQSARARFAVTEHSALVRTVRAHTLHRKGRRAHTFSAWLRGRIAARRAPRAAPDIAERGFNTRTFGLWAQHADHCATPLVKAMGKSKQAPNSMLITFGGSSSGQVNRRLTARVSASGCGARAAHIAWCSCKGGCCTSAWSSMGDVRHWLATA